MSGAQPVVYLSGLDGAPEAALARLADHFQMLAPSQVDREDLPEFIRRAVGGPAHVIAESTGAAVGCWLAISHPDLVNSLVLVTPELGADLVARLPEITAPTLILWGTADEVTPPELGQAYLRAIPNSYRMLIYGAGHSLASTACRQFVALTTDFIERGDRFVVAEPGTSE